MSINSSTKEKKNWTGSDLFEGQVVDVIKALFQLDGCSPLSVKLKNKPTPTWSWTKVSGVKSGESHVVDFATLSLAVQV